MKKEILLLLMGISLTACASEYYYEHGKRVTVTKSYEQRGVDNSNVEYYTTQNGHRVGVSDEIIIQCEEAKECKTTLKKYNLQKISKLSDKLYLVTINDGENIFEISQKLYNDSNIQLAHPNFIKAKKRR